MDEARIPVHTQHARIERETERGRETERESVRVRLRDRVSEIEKEHCRVSERE